MTGRKRDTKERNKRKMIKKCEESGNRERKKKHEILIVWWSRQERKAITFGSEDKIKKNEGKKHMRVAAKSNSEKNNKGK